jgi:hypothetical protein
MVLDAQMNIHHFFFSSTAHAVFPPFSPGFPHGNTFRVRAEPDTMSVEDLSSQMRKAVRNSERKQGELRFLGSDGFSADGQKDDAERFDGGCLKT